MIVAPEVTGQNVLATLISLVLSACFEPNSLSTNCEISLYLEFAAELTITVDLMLLQITANSSVGTNLTPAANFSYGSSSSISPRVRSLKPNQQTSTS